MNIIKHTHRNSNTMQMHFKRIQVGSDRHICISYQKDRHIYAHNKYVCKNRPWSFIRVHGALIALELWFTTIFNALNNHLRKIPLTCHFNSFLSVQGHTIIPRFTLHNTFPNFAPAFTIDRAQWLL